MNEQEAWDEDAVERLLGTCQTPTVDAGKRQAILRQTIVILRRRRRLRRLGFVTALAACYVAGLGTMRLGLPAPGNSPPPLIVENHTVDSQTASLPVPAPVSSAPTLENDPDAPALVIERIAAASEDQKARLYRAAGDRYLENEGDMQAAVRCYSQALVAAKGVELFINEDDNWLLMALKKAHFEEKNHEKNGG